MITTLPFPGTVLAAAVLAACEFVSTGILGFGRYSPVSNKEWIERLEFVYNVNDVIRLLSRVCIEYFFIELFFSLLRICAPDNGLGLWAIYGAIVVCRAVLFTSAQYLFLKHGMKRND